MSNYTKIKINTDMKKIYVNESNNQYLIVFKDTNGKFQKEGPLTKESYEAYIEKCKNRDKSLKIEPFIIKILRKEEYVKRPALFSRETLKELCHTVEQLEILKEHEDFHVEALHKRGYECDKRAKLTIPKGLIKKEDYLFALKYPEEEQTRLISEYTEKKKKRYLYAIKIVCRIDIFDYKEIEKIPECFAVEFRQNPKSLILYCNNKS